jgi:hypothetical protein
MKQNGAITTLRWGIAFVLFYGSLVALIWPERALVQIPELIASGKPILAMFSLYELILSGFLFSGKKVFWSSLLATLTFTAIIVFEISRQENNHNNDTFE